MVGIQVKVTRGTKRKRESEWFHCGAAMCFGKDEDTHREVFKMVFEKTKKEQGYDALGSIVELDTDFERQIYVPLAEELNSQKMQLKSVKPARTNLCSGHYACNLNKKIIRVVVKNFTQN